MSRFDASVNSSARRTAKAVCVALVLSFAFSLLLGSGLTRTSGGLPAHSLDLAEAELTGALLLEDGSIWVYTENATITFHDVPYATQTLGVHTGPVENYNVSLQAVVYTPSGAQMQTSADQAWLSPNGSHNSAVLRLRSPQPVGTVHLSLWVQDGSCRITGLTLNESGFSFNYSQFFFLFIVVIALWGVWQSGLHRQSYSPHSPRHRHMMWGMTAIVCCFIVWLMFAVSDPQIGLLWQYHPGDLESLNSEVHYTQYYHLFDALKHGQLSMRTLPAPELAKLVNPYDYTARSTTYYLWDFAYYSGQYYVYFGLAPMPLYFLVYFLTGQLPAPALACAVPALLAVIALCGALRELLSHYKIKANLLMTLLALPAVAGGSLLLLLMACSDTYAQPYLWGMAGVWGMVWALYRALRTRRPIVRRLLFMLAGVCVVYVAASRPTMLFAYLAFALPLLLHILRQKERKISKKILDIAALALPVAAGALLLMAYNAARFGSPFDFGTAYQLTVGDMRQQTMRFSPVWLLQALFFFLFQPLLIQPRFPYVWAGIPNQYYYGTFFYNFTLIGLANFPLYWGLAGTPATLRRQSALKKGTYIGILVSSALVLWVVYCISNLHYRYPADAAVALALLAALLLLEIAGCRPPGQIKGRYLLACGMLAATILLGLLLCFTNERDFILRFHTDTYLFISDMLSIG